MPHAQTRIGLLYPVSSGFTQEYRDFAAGLDVPVELHMVRTGGLDRHDSIGIIETGKIDRLRAGIHALRVHKPHVVAFACTCASFGYPKGAWEQAAEMSRLAGVPATSASVAMVAACNAVGARTVALAATYPAEITLLLTDFLRSQGVTVAGSKSLSIMSGAEVSQLSADAVFGFIRQSGIAGTDAIVVPDTALFTLPHITRLENELGKFVVTANQAIMWHALRLAGVSSLNPRFGRLMAYDVQTCCHGEGTIGVRTTWMDEKGDT